LFLTVNSTKILTVLNAKNKATCISSYKSVAKVSSTGKVTTEAPGTVIIYDL